MPHVMLRKISSLRERLASQDMRWRTVAVPGCCMLHAMQVKRILGRRSLYEGRYRYAGVEADGQHLSIFERQ
jgi:hypothetical protein